MADESVLATAIVNFTGRDAGLRAMQAEVLAGTTRTTAAVAGQASTASAVIVNQFGKPVTGALQMTENEMRAIGDSMESMVRGMAGVSPGVDVVTGSHIRLGTELRHSTRLFTELTGNVINQFAPAIERGVMQVGAMGRSFGAMGIAMAAPLVLFQVGTQVIGYFITKAEEMQKAVAASNAAIADLDASKASAGLKEFLDTMRDVETQSASVTKEWKTWLDVLAGYVGYFKGVFGPSIEELGQKAEIAGRAFAKVTLPKQQAEDTKQLLEVMTTETERLLKTATYTNDFEGVFQKINDIAKSSHELALQEIKDADQVKQNQLAAMADAAKKADDVARAELASIQKVSSANIAAAENVRNANAAELKKREEAAKVTAAALIQANNNVGMQQAETLRKATIENEKYTNTVIANADKAAAALLAAAKAESDRLAQKLTDEAKLDVARTKAAQSTVDLAQKQLESTRATEEAEASFASRTIDNLAQYQAARRAAITATTALERQALDEQYDADHAAGAKRVENYKRALKETKALEIADAGLKKQLVEQATQVLAHEVNAQTGLEVAHSAAVRDLSTKTATQVIDDERKVTTEIRAQFAQRVANAEAEAGYLIATGQRTREAEIAVQQEVLASDLASVKQKQQAEEKALSISKQLAQERMTFAVSMGRATADQEIAFERQIAVSTRSTEQERAAAVEKASTLMVKSYEDALAAIKAVYRVSAQDELAFLQAEARLWEEGSARRIAADQKVADFRKKTYDDMARQGESLFDSTVRLLKEEGAQNITLIGIEQRANQQQMESKQLVDDFFAGIVGWSPKVEAALQWQRQFGNIAKEGVSAGDAITVSFQKLTETFATSIDKLVDGLDRAAGAITGMVGDVNQFADAGKTSIEGVGSMFIQMGADINKVVEETGIALTQNADGTRTFSNAIGDMDIVVTRTADGVTKLSNAAQQNDVIVKTAADGTRAFSNAAAEAAVSQGALGTSTRALSDVLVAATSQTNNLDSALSKLDFASKYNAEYQRVLAVTDTFYIELLAKIAAGNSAVGDAIYNVFYTRVREALDAESASS